MHRKEKEFLYIYAVMLIAVTVIFIALYHKFLFGGYLYAYSDIGSDTINTYLPNMIYEIRSIWERTGGHILLILVWENMSQIFCISILIRLIFRFCFLGKIILTGH